MILFAIVTIRSLCFIADATDWVSDRVEIVTSVFGRQEELHPFLMADYRPIQTRGCPPRGTEAAHNWGFRSQPGDQGLHDLEWDVENKRWIRGVRTYAYCTDCDRWAWEAASACPAYTTDAVMPSLAVSRRTT